jgi:predicted naringenin-chalcone synthase
MASAVAAGSGFMSLAILGMGTAVPQTAIDQVDATDIATNLCCRTPEHRTWLPLMYQQTGIRTRRMLFSAEVVRDLKTGSRDSGSCFLPTGSDDDAGPTTGQRMGLYREEAAVLATQAMIAALYSADVEPGAITHLVTVSCTGFHAPGFDLELIRHLPLSPNVARTHIGFMGCHGALNGLRVARAFADADPYARIAMCATELCSLHYHFGWDPQKMVANALFGDGSAVVIGAADAVAPSEWQVLANGSCVIPDSVDAMSWSLGDHGFEMSLSKQVPHLIREHLRPWLSQWLASHGLTVEQIASWAIHPGGPRILEAVEEGLRLNQTQTKVAREVFAEYGNMSSPTVLFILDRLMQQDAPTPCVALGFGPGMTAEAALLGRHSDVAPIIVD